MVGPLFSLGTELASKGQGMPFDVLSIGYNIGSTQKLNVAAIIHLLEEGKLIADNLGDNLPESFPTDIYDISLSRLKTI